MKMKLAGVVAVAAFAVAMSGCASATGTGGTGGGSGGGGGGSKFCTSTSCATGETCHPSSKTCVKTCNFGTDCTSEAKTCALAVGATATSDGGGVFVCSCLTTSLCSGSSGVAGNICSDYDKVCTGKCASNSDCPNNRTCDTTSGQCAAPGGASDGGSDGGTDGGTDGGSGCTRGSCSGSQICNFQSGVCETPKACTTSNVQPDVCGYGQFCNGTCSEVAVGSCSNFAAGSNPTLWSGRTSTGPAIYSITKFSFGTDATFCGATNTTRAKIHVKAYAQTNVLLSETNQPALNYVRTDGNELAVGATQIQNYTSTGSGKAAEFDVNFCAPAGITSLTVGLYYTGGNAACFTVN
jgi:hypothetical protein